MFCSTDLKFHVTHLSQGKNKRVGPFNEQEDLLGSVFPAAFVLTT